MVRLVCRVAMVMMPLLALCLPDLALAQTPGQMMQECRVRAGKAFHTRLPNIDTKYEGQRTDGTHAVNGTAIFSGRTETFQCSFNKRGTKIIRFVVNKKTAQPAKPAGDALVAGTEFHATGTIPCARASGQPMGQCKFGVVREGGGNGWVKVFWPDTGNRVIFFKAGTPASYDEAQADGGAKMKVAKNADLFVISIGEQRFEIPDAVISGG